MTHRNVSTVTLALLVILLLDVACNKSESRFGPGESNAALRSKTGPLTAGETFLASLPPGTVIPDKDDEVGWRLLAEYGSVLVARGNAVPPPFIIFPDGKAVDDWQASVKTMRTNLGGTWIELQTPAMTALIEARAEAQSARLNISPRGTNAGRRSYEETVKLWKSRVNPGLEHWSRGGRLTREEAARIRALSPRDQILEILRLEKKGFYFSTDFSKSILDSVAAPGSSQHLSMLAFDVKENGDSRVRSILARHGWFQTVSSDAPHFTFLGVTEEQLPSIGLKKVTTAGRAYWIPSLE